MRPTATGSTWRKYRSTVWISDAFGIVTRVNDGLWFAYPYPRGELGPFFSMEEAQRALECRQPQQAFAGAVTARPA